MEQYLTSTTDTRGDIREIFISTKKPYKPVSRNTVSRWTKFVLQTAGINTVFGDGSPRAAASTKARQCGLPLDEILSAGGWARESTFAKFYQKELCEAGNSFASAVLR